jgi:glycosyltransferase involved in cell wall biosynthesis
MVAITADPSHPNTERYPVTEPPNAPSLTHVAVIIPALNEAESLGSLLPILRKHDLGQIIVADNGSDDETAAVAKTHHAAVVHEPRRGYGAACFAGMQNLIHSIEVVVFLDADLSDDPNELPILVEPILSNRADLVISDRDPHLRSAGAMTAPQRFGTWLAVKLIQIGWGYRYRDLGPFRAVRRSALDRIDMQDRAYGWTVEMQIRAVELGLRIEQIAVPYRNRVGQSKISGTVTGVFKAGYWILTTIGGYWLSKRRRSRSDRARLRSNGR